jgi:hypothetical protein
MHVEETKRNVENSVKSFAGVASCDIGGLVWFFSRFVMMRVMGFASWIGALELPGLNDDLTGLEVRH